MSHVMTYDVMTCQTYDVTPQTFVLRIHRPLPPDKSTEVGPGYSELKMSPGATTFVCLTWCVNSKV